MPKKNLRKQLALALEIPEDSILQYARYGDHYSVITTNFQKFNDVYPAPLEVEEEPEEVETAVTPTEIEKPPLQPDFDPALQSAWNNPRKAKVGELRQLAGSLGVKGVHDMKKADLVNAIVAYKIDYYA